MSSRRASSRASGPDERHLSDAIRPGWNEHMSLQEASASVQRLARFEPGVVAELPEESVLHIEVNGSLAGAIRCLPDAPAELALGWAFMHRFFDVPEHVDSVSVHDDRVSLMIHAGVDVDSLRLQAAGWSDETDCADSQEGPEVEPFVVHAEVLLGVVRSAFGVMAKDRARDGFVHAAVASDTGVHCVARDQAVLPAIAKIAGWMLRDGATTETPIVIVRGMIDRQVVESMSRLGVSLLVTTGIPTADAFRAATGQNVSLLGMASSQRPGLLVDAGHVIEDADEGNEPGNSY